MAVAGGGGAHPSCAACKYQRRRCAEDCPLAPYFPHDQPRVFSNAHRLFGVRNILKTLDAAGPDPDRRHEAMQCVVYESQAWDLYPSAGCVPIIVGLQSRIQQAEHDLRRVHADLEAYRRRAAPAFGARYSAEATSSSSLPPAPPFQLQWSADEGIAAARDDNAAAVTSNDGNMMAPPPPQTLPWTIQPPPQLFYYGQHQPIVASTQQQPELQDDDMMNYFADGGINGENDEMPRESSTDSSVKRR